MVKKRLIFTLLYNENNYCLSRNFSLQSVGDLEWLNENYDFENIANSIDELIVVNVNRDSSISVEFCDSIKKLANQCFIPIGCGGGIKSVDDAYRLLDSGADKIIINTLAFENKDIVKQMVDIFGSQFVVGSADFKNENGNRKVFCKNGSIDTGLMLDETIRYFEDLGVGEIILNSISKDGTGQGFDKDALIEASKISHIPIIAAGGAGKPNHFYEILALDSISATSTANLFNFMAGGLKDARHYLLEKKINLANWESI